MFLTQEDYRKIESWLKLNSKKDTDFDFVDSIDGSETIAIVQGNKNKRIFLRDFINEVGALFTKDLVNVSADFGLHGITLETAIQAIPLIDKKEGLVITFEDTDSNWRIYQFIGKLTQWNLADLWQDILNWESFAVDSLLPDEEDITATEPDGKGNAKLKFADKEYNPDSFSGLGHVILRKNLVEVMDPETGKSRGIVNLLYQDIIKKENTVYEIKYDFDLNGLTIVIPNNCILKFNGGSINNGEIYCNNTFILKAFNIFDKVVLSGSLLNSCIEVDWFNFHIYNDPDINGETLKEFIIPSAINLKASIFLSENGVYNTSRNFRLVGADINPINMNGASLYGTGSNGIKYIALSDTRDGIIIINIYNFSVHDLLLEVVDTSPDTVYDGSNGVVLSGELWNVSIYNMKVKDIPFKLRDNGMGGYYINGGKAYTRLHKLADGHTWEEPDPPYFEGFTKNLKIYNCISENCPYGFETSIGHGDSVDSIFSMSITNNYFKNAHIGVELSLYGNTLTETVITNNTFEGCQLGIICETYRGVNISNNIFNNPSETNYVYKEIVAMLFRTINDSIISNNIIAHGYDYGIIMNGLSNSPYYDYNNNIITSNNIKSNIRGIVIGNYTSDDIKNNQNATAHNITLYNNIVNCVNEDAIPIEIKSNVEGSEIHNYKFPGELGYTAFSTGNQLPIWYNGTEYVDSNGIPVIGKKFGTIAERPNVNLHCAGATYYCTDDDTLYLNTGHAWLKVNVSIPRPMYGLISEVPTSNLFYGDMYFATDLAEGRGCPIWYNYKTRKWVDATGAEV